MLHRPEAFVMRHIGFKRLESCGHPSHLLISLVYLLEGLSDEMARIYFPGFLQCGSKPIESIFIPSLFPAQPAQAQITEIKPVSVIDLLTDFKRLGKIYPGRSVISAIQAQASHIVINPNQPRHIICLNSHGSGQFKITFSFVEITQAGVRHTQVDPRFQQI
jgi:hypothetical protein